MPRILCLIENIGPSGAERQLTNLAVLLKKKGHEVEVAYYVKKEFYLPFLQENGVGHCFLDNASNPIKRFFTLRKHIRKYRPDTIVSYSVSPCMITCLLKLLGAKFNLIVSERNTTQKIDRREKLKFFLYKWANHIVPNSQSQGDFIAKHYPNLSEQVTVITNYVDTNMFVPSQGEVSELDVLRMICVGRLAPQKNIPAFLDAVAILKSKGCRFRIDWYGQDFKNNYSQQCYDSVKKNGLDDIFFFHPQSSEIIQRYQESDIFCLPSLYEGFPNVLCEAMCCGLPVLCSNVCDNPRIMHDGINGFLFNPHGAEDMAEKMEKMIRLSAEERRNMAQKSREIAVGLFSSDVFVGKYIELL